MSDEAWTIGRLLTWTEDYLRTRDAESPRLDAEVLLAHASGCQRIELYTRYEEPADEKLRERFRALVRRRAEGVPVAYLAGRREFFSLPFAVNRDVLIPRPETEQLVVRAIDIARETGRERPIAIADVGTGSGCLAIALAKQLPTAQVVALDISHAALKVAAENADRHEVADRVRLIESDLFAGLPSNEQFDLIVSNPPYVRTDEFAGLPTEVREHEPRLALDGGAEGTDVYDRLIPQAAERLRPGGWLIAEIGPNVAERVAAILDATPGLKRAPVLDDLAGLPRVAQAQREEAS